MKRLKVLKKRLKKVDIEVEFAANYPWIYLDTINKKRVTEKYCADHGFTIGFLPMSRDKPFHFTELSVIFKLLRKYCKKKKE